MPRMPFYSDLGNLAQAHECLRIPPQKYTLFSQMVLAAFLMSPKAILRASQIIAQLSRAYPKTVSFSELRVNQLDRNDLELIDWLLTSGIVYTFSGSGRLGRVCQLTEEFAATIPRGEIRKKFRPSRKMASAVRNVEEPYNV